MASELEEVDYKKLYEKFYKESQQNLADVQRLMSEKATLEYRNKCLAKKNEMLEDLIKSINEKKGETKNET